LLHGIQNLSAGAAGLKRTGVHNRPEEKRPTARVDKIRRWNQLGLLSPDLYQRHSAVGR
jgi:hypothetical protein